MPFLNIGHRIIGSATVLSDSPNVYSLCVCVWERERERNRNRVWCVWFYAHIYCTILVLISDHEKLRYMRVPLYITPHHMLCGNLLFAHPRIPWLQREIRDVVNLWHFCSCCCHNVAAAVIVKMLLLSWCCCCCCLIVAVFCCFRKCCYHNVAAAAFVVMMLLLLLYLSQLGCSCHDVVTMLLPLLLTWTCRCCHNVAAVVVVVTCYCCHSVVAGVVVTFLLLLVLLSGCCCWCWLCYCYCFLSWSFCSYSVVVGCFIWFC